MSPDRDGASETLDRFGFVTKAGRERLNRFVALLEIWQRTHNLVAASQLGELWGRHVADSVQLVEAAPDFREWVDLGSGAGFPGLIVAAVFADDPNRHFTLVESNNKKAAFLRAAIRETGANAAVASARIEQHSATMQGRADIVSARALASFDELCRLAYPYLHDESLLLFLKGQDFVHEEREAAKSWEYDLLTSQSFTDPSGCVVRVRNLKPRKPDARL